MDNLHHIMQAWIARAGDPQISAVINTVLYAVSAFFALRRWKSLKVANGPAQEQTFWLVLFFVLLFLGINKQLDLQVLLIEIGRPLAQQGGWYESRRMALAAFAFLASGVAFLFVAGVIHLVKKHWQRNLLALSGLLVLLGYFIVEATSQSHMGLSLDAQEKWGVRATDLIEMAGVMMILTNALKKQEGT